MDSNELRKKFLSFFKERGHAIVSSSSLIPTDPSVLLTTAGMQQFKPYYTGEKDALKDFGTQRTASIQKSFRTSDIDQVGDESHLTFFEMLGNFSFGPVGQDQPDNFGKGGYFKKAAIYWAHEFITKELKIQNEKLKISVFAGDEKTPFDEESYRIWKDEIGLPEESLERRGREDNFWGPTGSEGPCGPTAEIYVGGVEIWNLVFNEYYCHKDGWLEKLKNPGVDTGMGLERLAMVMQEKNNVFETDLFEPIITIIGHQMSSRTSDVRITRIIADHLRGSFFLIQDGVLPSNKEAGYILRRLLRRVIRYEKICGLGEEFYKDILGEIIKIYGDFYELNREKIFSVFSQEREKFLKTLERGLKEFEKIKAKGISGEEAFYLYETFGFPFDLTKDLAKEQGIEISEAEFQRALEKHQEVSRVGAENKFRGGLAETTEETIKLHTAAHLLLEALRRVLGSHVVQKGSNITAERLRLDFPHPEKMTEVQIREVENMVNEKIRENLPVVCEEMSLEEAKNRGALGVFEHKYGDKVKVYFIGDPSAGSGQVFSKEICGGPHVPSTGQLGRFKIIKEESVAAGIRRIRAILD